MAPPAPGNLLKPNEEEWREVFNRLCERFPTVKHDTVVKALRTHNGHPGQAAAVLRDLTGSGVKEADPEDVEHVATLLSSPAMFKHACKEQFRKFDINKDGVLEWEEVKNLVNNLYDEFGLQLPSEGSLKAFFYATDENQDGVLSEREFRKFFEMFLRYAFFDHLKLRQMVEKGQAIEAERNAQGLKPGEISKKGKLLTTDVADDDETTSPLDSRASSASSCKPSKESRPDTRPDETSQPVMPKSQSKPVLAPVEQQSKPVGRQSPPAGRDRNERSERAERSERSERHNHREHRDHRSNRQEKERTPTTDENTQRFVCVAKNGVAYRASAEFQDRSESTPCGRGECVQVLEHWIRTPDGWLPVMDQQGQSLFERSGDPAADGSSSKKRVSIQESSSRGRSKDDTLEANIRTSAPHVPSSPPGEAGGKLLQPSEEEWRPVFDRLRERFPNITQEKIAQALRDNEGHAGKAASMLRYM